jgi:hypothetical protein
VKGFDDDVPAGRQLNADLRRLAQLCQDRHAPCIVCEAIFPEGNPLGALTRIGNGRGPLRELSRHSTPHTDLFSALPRPQSKTHIAKPQSNIAT